MRLTSSKISWDKLKTISTISNKKSWDSNSSKLNLRSPKKRILNSLLPSSIWRVPSKIYKHKEIQYLFSLKTNRSKTEMGRNRLIVWKERRKMYCKGWLIQKICWSATLKRYRLSRISWDRQNKKYNTYQATHRLKQQSMKSL